VLLLAQDTENSRKMHLIAFLNSYSEGLSGSDLRFVEVSKRVLSRIDLIVVTSELGFNLCEKRGLKARFFLTSRENYFSHVFITYALRILFALFIRLETNDRTILYSTSDFLPDVFPAYVLKLKNKKAKWVQLIHHIQENPLRRVGENYFVNLAGFISQRLSFALIKQRVDLTIVVNPLVKRELLKKGFNGKKIFVNYNGVNLSRIKDFKDSPFKYDGVFLGRLNVSKGVFDLLKVWSYVVEKNPNAKLAVIGSGDKRVEKKLRETTSEMKLQENIAFLGYLSDSDAFGILKSAKVFLFPSYEEGFGIAILEAMTCGLPVVTYNLHVYREIFGNSLSVVPVGRTDLMSEIVCFLLENPEVAKLKGQAGVELAKKYDWSKIAEKELSLMKSIE
jgi:glycosyltransferase involved in cell wall biosynthesis